MVVHVLGLGHDAKGVDLVQHVALLPLLGLVELALVVVARQLDQLGWPAEQALHQAPPLGAPASGVGVGAGGGGGGLEEGGELVPGGGQAGGARGRVRALLEAVVGHGRLGTRRGRSVGRDSKDKIRIFRNLNVSFVVQYLSTELMVLRLRS